MKFKHTPSQARQIWAAALLSGEYKQGCGVLKTEQGNFCCLGVACEEYKKHENPLFEYKADYKNLRHYPEVQEWLGLNHCEGLFRDRKSANMHLTNINDEQSDSFPIIAKIIEEKPSPRE